jgi:hypothetical protein
LSAERSSRVHRLERARILWVIALTGGVSAGTNVRYVMEVPRDRIELSTPGFSVGQTGVRGRPLSSIIVFKRAMTKLLTSGVV